MLRIYRNVKILVFKIAPSTREQMAIILKLTTHWNFLASAEELPKSSNVRDVSPKYYIINLVETFEDAYSVSKNVEAGSNEYSERITQFSDKMLWYSLQYTFQRVSDCYGYYQMQHVSAILHL